MNRWLIMLLSAAALTVTGCNKQESSTVETDKSVETTGTATAEDTMAPAETSTEDAAAPAEATPADAAPAPEAAAEATAATPATAGNETTLPGGTVYVDEVVGTGTEAVQGSTVSVHYTGTLTDGTKFDSSRDRNRPFSFTIGEGGVIKGWEEGVAGMKVGGKRKLTIPADQAYGDRQTGPIPANSTLMFDIELLGVQ